MYDSIVPVVLAAKMRLLSLNLYKELFMKTKGRLRIWLKVMMLSYFDVLEVLKACRLFVI